MSNLVNRFNDPSNGKFSPTLELDQMIEGETVLCRCHSLSVAEIAVAIETHRPETVRELGKCNGAGTGCMSCHVRIKKMIRAARESA